MGLITTGQFLRLADRLAADYELAVGVEQVRQASTDRYATIILTPPSGLATVDPDLATLADPAQRADAGVTAVALVRGVVVLENLQGAVSNYFTRVGYAGGMVAFIENWDLTVHRNFSLLYEIRTGLQLPASLVFRPDTITLGTVNRGSGESITFVPGMVLGTGGGRAAVEPANYAPQALVATVMSVGVALAGDWLLTFTVLDRLGRTVMADPVVFPAGSGAGTSVPVTALGTDDRFLAVTGLSDATGGSAGDQVIVTQIPDRIVSL